MNVHDGTFKPDGIVFLDEMQAKTLDNVILEENDVLLNITGASVARVCRLPPSYAGGRVNQHVAIIRPRVDQLHPEYLAQCLIAPPIRHELLRIAGAGATREAITKGSIQQFELPLPPLDEQRRIAAILDQANVLRSKRREAIRRLNQLPQTIFQKEFGENRGYPKSTLAEACDLITDGTHFTPTYSDSGTIFLSARNVTTGKINWDNIKFVPQSLHIELQKRVSPKLNDVLLAKNGIYRLGQ